jgi:hypothetical protein
MTDVSQQPHETEPAAPRVRPAARRKARRKVVKAPTPPKVPQDISTDAAAKGDPLRVALASAIKAAGKARQAIQLRKAGIKRLWDEQREGEEQIEKLKKAVTRATSAHIDAIATAAALEKAAPASGVPAARQAVAVAEDHFAALRAARKKLEADLPLWEADAVRADAEVERLISEILKPVAEQIIERGRQIAEQLLPIKSMLSALWCQSDRPSQWGAGAIFDTGRAPLKETRAAAADFLRSTAEWDRAVPDPFLIAREKLRTDPQAELPTELTALLG